jgi:arsenite-transporting ATPase
MDADKLKTPYMFLQDPDYAKLLIVTLPETTPITEAAKLQDDLRRSGIEPYAWIANQSMSASKIMDPLLKLRAEAEIPLLQKTEREHARKLYALPWISEENILEEMIAEPAAISSSH